MRSNKIILHGAFQVENFGDTLLLHVYAEKIKKINSSLNIVVSNASTHALETTGLQPISKRELLISREPIIFCGGGYLGERKERQFKWGLNLLIRHLFVGFQAILKKQEYVIIGVGFGPLTKKWYKLLTLFIIQKSSLFAVRDKESIDYYLSYGGKTQPKLVADAILSLRKEDLLDLRLVQNSFEAPKKKTFLLHLMGGADSQIIRKEIFEYVKMVVRNNDNLELVLLCDNGVNIEPDFFKWSNDTAKESFYSPEKTLNLINNCEYIITTKLHVGICSAILGKNVLALPLHSKTKRFYKQIDRDDACIDMRENSIEEIKMGIDKLLSGDIGPVNVPVNIRNLADSIWTEVESFINEKYN